MLSPSAAVSRCRTARGAAARPVVTGLLNSMLAISDDDRAVGLVGPSAVGRRVRSAMSPHPQLGRPRPGIRHTRLVHRHGPYGAGCPEDATDVDEIDRHRHVAGASGPPRVDIFGQPIRSQSRWGTGSSVTSATQGRESVFLPNRGTAPFAFGIKIDELTECNRMLASIVPVPASIHLRLNLPGPLGCQRFRR